jgi:GntR family transcriptional regulator
VAADLRQKIESGVYAPQDRLPTMNALMAEYGVTSRPAMQKVLAQLAADGLIITVRRQGSFVRRYDPLSWRVGPPDVGRDDDSGGGGDFDAWLAAVTARGGVPRGQVATVLEHPSAAVARRLRIAETVTVTAERQIRSVDGAPTQVVVGYAAARGDGPSCRAPALGVDPDVTVGADDRPRCVDLPPGTPVVEHARTWFDDAGVPTRLVVAIARGDSHILRYEFPGSNNC